MSIQPIYVLLIDDKKTYCDLIEGSARLEQINIKSATNLEDGIDILSSDKRIEFVILDGKCFTDADQETTNLLEDNIPHQAKSLIDEINRNQNREIGYCVNTGFVDDLNKSFKGIFTVFEKSPDSSALFDFIKRSVEDSERRKLMRIYKEAFEVFENGILPSSKEEVLINLVKRLESKTYEQEGFNVGRGILEEIYKTLILKYACIPKVCLKSAEEVNFTYCTIFMGGWGPKYILDVDGNKYPNHFEIPKHIASIFGYLNSNLNLLSHTYPNEYNKYAFISAVNGLLEILVWLPKFIKENFK
jgi:hypothetical protein